MIAFCEAPVLIDAELMRRVLDDAEKAKDPVGPSTAGLIASDRRSGDYRRRARILKEDAMRVVPVRESRDQGACER